MRKFVLVLLASLSLLLGLVGSASATPSEEHWPANPNACVGYSSTSANAIFSDVKSKYRSDQARGVYTADDERGRKDDIQDIREEPRCNPE